MKHVGKMKNNGARVAVAFRTIPGDPHSALVIGTNGHEAGVDALQAVARCSPQGGQICTGTEGFPCSGDNDGVDGVVCFGPMHRVTQLGGHALGDRVSALGIVDGDNGNSVADVIENQFRHEA